jgi:cystathionine beta-synthase
LEHILANPLENSDTEIKDILHSPFPMVSMDLAVKELSKYITKENSAVMVKDNMGALHILTQYDIIQAL